MPVDPHDGDVVPIMGVTETVSSIETDTRVCPPLAAAADRQSCNPRTCPLAIGQQRASLYRNR